MLFQQVYDTTKKIGEMDLKRKVKSDHLMTLLHLHNMC